MCGSLRKGLGCQNAAPKRKDGSYSTEIRGWQEIRAIYSYRYQSLIQTYSSLSKTRVSPHPTTAVRNPSDALYTPHACLAGPPPMNTAS